MEEIETGIDWIIKTRDKDNGDSKSDMAGGRNVKLREVKSWTDGQWIESNDFVNSKVN